MFALVLQVAVDRGMVVAAAQKMRADRKGCMADSVEQVGHKLYIAEFVGTLEVPQTVHAAERRDYNYYTGMTFFQGL